MAQQKEFGPIGKFALRYNKLEHILRDGNPHSVRSLFNMSILRDEFIVENAIDNALRTLTNRGKLVKIPFKDNQYPNIRFAYEWKNKDECHKRSSDDNLEQGISIPNVELEVSAQSNPPANIEFKPVVIIDKESIYIELEKFKVTINLK